MEDWRTAKYLTTKGEVLVLTDYEVSNYGRFRNKKTGRFLSVLPNQYGYYLAHPCINGKMKNYSIHRLVLSSFTDNVDGSLEVNHKDENKENNCLTNLEWTTAKENINYGTRNERAGKAQINGKKSKPVLQFDLNGNFIREWPSLNEVKRQLGINQGNICSCCNGIYKSAGGFIWRYLEQF